MPFAPSSDTFAVYSPPTQSPSSSALRFFSAFFPFEGPLATSKLKREQSPQASKRATCVVNPSDPKSIGFSGFYFFGGAFWIKRGEDKRKEALPYSCPSLA